MRSLAFLVGLLVAGSGHAEAPYWTGKEIAATADKIRTARIDDRERKRRADRDWKRGDEGWIYIGPSVTVGAGSLDPVYGRYYGSYGGLTSPRERDDLEKCIEDQEGPPSASSAIAAAAGNSDRGRC